MKLHPSPGVGVGGGGLLHTCSNKPMEMCCWKGSHFQDRVDYNEVDFNGIDYYGIDFNGVVILIGLSWLLE